MSGYFPYNPNAGQQIRGGGRARTDMGFIAHFQVLAAKAVAASTNGVMALRALAAAAQAGVSTGLTSPTAPRNLQIVGNVAGINGKVTIHGTNYADEAISEEFTANGVTPVLGNKAFKSVTSVDLPIRNHVPAKQTETKAVTHKADAAGTITLTLTAAGLTGSPLATEVEVAQDDTAIQVATKIVAALNAVAAIAAMFILSNEDGASATVTITAKAYAADDATLSLAFVDTDTTGVTMGASTNGTAGIVEDKISIGWGDKLGLPFKLAHNTVFPGMTYLNNVKEGTDPTVAVSASAVESNTIDLNSALNGTIVDSYLIV